MRLGRGVVANVKLCKLPVFPMMGYCFGGNDALSLLLFVDNPSLHQTSCYSLSLQTHYPRHSRK